MDILLVILSIIAGMFGYILFKEKQFKGGVISFALAILFFVGFGLMTDASEDTVAEDDTVVEDEEIPELETNDEIEETNDNEEESEPEKSSEFIYEIDETFSFIDFTVELLEASYYEEDGSEFLDVRIRWWNDSFPTETSFMAAGGITPYQGEDHLEEVSGIVENVGSGNYYYEASQGISTPITFTYELISSEEEIRIVLFSYDEHDKNEEYILEIER